MGAAPTPGSSLLLPPAPSVSGANLRFPPALKIVLAARLCSPGNELLDWELSALWIGAALHPHNSQLSKEEVGRPHRFFLGAPGPPCP